MFVKDWRTATFFLAMGAASALGIIKLWLLAALLDPVDFTKYAAVFALATFAAAPISFGAVERTTKEFPRLFQLKRFHDLSESFALVVRRVVRRHLAVATVAFAGAWLFWDVERAIAAGAVSAFALATNLFGVAASLFRGLDLLPGLAAMTIVRTTLGMIAALSAGAAAGWLWGFASESVVLVGLSFIVVSLLSRRVARHRAEAPPSAGDAAQVSSDRDSVWLFFAFLALSVPLSVDRALVASLDNVAEAARYAFAAIWLTGAYTFASIYVQKAGPDLIRLALDHPPGAVRRAAFRHMLVLFAANTAIAALGFVICYVFAHHAIVLKYSLDAPMIAATVVASAMQVTPVLDWALIARDREKHLLASGVIFTGVWASLAIAAFLSGLGAPGYVAAAALARIIQIGVETAFLRRERAGTA